MANEVKKKKLKLFLLFYLIIMTSFLSMITLSKFKSTVTGNGSIQIAKWSVSLNTGSNTSDNIDLIAGNNEISYNINVKSLSEVKVGYSIIVSNIPNDVKVKLDTGTYQTPSSNKVTFSQVGTINANASTKEKNHTLTFTAPISSATVNNKSMDIDVVFVQLQS